jgi:hypothetical protein
MFEQPCYPCNHVNSRLSYLASEEHTSSDTLPNLPCTPWVNAHVLPCMVTSWGLVSCDAGSPYHYHMWDTIVRLCRWAQGRTKHVVTPLRYACICYWALPCHMHMFPIPRCSPSGRGLPHNFVSCTHVYPSLLVLACCPTSRALPINDALRSPLLGTPWAPFPPFSVVSLTLKKRA